MKTTRYFQKEVLVKPPYLKMEWIEKVMAEAMKMEIQDDGRKRYWGYIKELGRILRVVALEDGTVHNAFPDRDFRKE